jgi:AcrR family transcriptional regulator
MLLQQHGYERLTIDQVAATARASKATIYRRWTTKAELVLAAVIEGISQVAVTPETGTLRGDLLEIADTVCEQANRHAATMRAVLAETTRDAALGDVLQREFFDQRRKVTADVMQRAIDRGEIRSAAVNDDLLDVLPGYLVYRIVIQNRPPTRRTVVALVDDVILPSLNRAVKSTE